MYPKAVIAFQGKYRFLSNFVPGWVEGEEFSVEKHYQAYKALLKGDEELRKRILEAKTPYEAKRLAQGLPRPGNATRWMWDAVNWKFKDPILRRMLLQTGEAELIEGNHWHDNFWGVCRCSLHYGSGLGLNHLGRILMELRGNLREEETDRRSEVALQISQLSDTPLSPPLHSPPEL